MENLAVLDMSYSDLEQLWKKPMQVLGSLKILNFSHCIKLVSVGGFSGLPALERLILVGCESLNHVCESIGHCDRLVLLDMSYCNKLRKLPNSIWKLKKVRILSISSCGPGVDEFPIDMKDMELLKVETIPKMILHSLPQSLVMLSLKNNNLSNESFPVGFSSLIKLKNLYLDNNPIDSLPTFVRSLSKLESLSLSGCSMIKSVLCPPSTLRKMSIKKCSSLMKITFHEEMSSLPYVEYMGAESLKVIPGVFKIQDLAQVDEKILSALGWTNLHCIKDQELDIWAPNMWVYKKKPVQMLYQFGTFSTCYLGKEVPDWLEVYKSSNGSSILSFIMPSTPVNKRFKGINIAYVHALGKSGGQFLSTIIVVNKTKNITWEYMGQLYVHREGNDEEMAVWLSHWMFGENEFEDGDEATLEIYGFLRDVMVNECVISPVYGDISSDMDEEDDDDPLTYYKSWKFRIGGDLSPFQEAPGNYSLFTKIRSG